MPFPSIKWFIAGIFAVGAVRFALSIGGMPNGTVRFVSMTAIVFVAAIYYAFACDTWKQRLKAAYLLILPYMIVEVSTLGFSLATGKQTIFSAPEYSFQTTPTVHFFGHLIGGVSFEPLSLFVLMQLVSFLRIRGQTPNC